VSPSPRQREYLKTIHDEAARRGYSASLREIAEKLGVSAQSVAAAVRLLKAAGLLDADYATARSMRLTDKGRDALREHAA
jgi:Mn-dependent DtxR family transcriptional regulator